MKLKKHNIDFKNIVLGFLLGICLVIAIGAASDGRGRYQSCTAGDNDEAVYVIDTHTGQTWRMGRIHIYDFGTPDQPKSERRGVTPIVK